MKTANKIYIIISVFVLVLLVLIAFGVSPIIKDIRKSSQDLILAKKSRATLEDQIKEINDFKKNYESYKPNFEKIDNLFIDKSNPVFFIEFLENAASSYGLVSEISLPSDLSEDGSQDALIFQISVEGVFSDIESFVKSIESGSYLIEIENLSIRNSTLKSLDDSSDYSSRRVSADLSIKTFIKK